MGATLKRRIDLINHHWKNRSKPRLGDGYYSATTLRDHLTTAGYGRYCTAAPFTVTSCHESAAALRFRVIDSLHLTSDDSLVRDNRRDVASQHEEIDFRAPFVLSMPIFSLCASYSAFQATSGKSSTPSLVIERNDFSDYLRKSREVQSMAWDLWVWRYHARVA